MNPAASNRHGYPVLAAPAEATEVIRRSRFLTRLGRAGSVEAAKEFIAEIRAADPGATHHCWAYLVGPPGSTARVGFSDDGEPHGTAGQPMLTTLLHSEVGDIVAVCTRHYGGVKLGTGGLARAYSGGVKAALDSATTVLKVSRIPARLVVDYADVEAVKRLMHQTQVVVQDEEYGARVVIVVGVPEVEWDGFNKAVGDATRGQGQVEATGDAVAE